MESKKDKCEILKCSLIENGKELRFWRERSWRFTGWLIGGFVVLSSLPVFTGKVYTLSFVIGGLTIFGTIYLIKNYYGYSKRLKYRERIERALGFFEQGAYIANEVLLPVDYEDPRPTRKGTGAFIGLVWTVAMAMILATI